MARFRDGLRGAVIVLALWTQVALATSYAQPTKHDVASPNGMFVLHVDPGSKTQIVVVAGDPTRARWSFHHDVGFASFYLANDGLTAAVVSWQFVQVDDLDDPAVEMWNASGRIKTYSHRELIASPPRIRGVGPIGSFWRQWRTGASHDGNVLVVPTTGPFAYAFNMTTGEITGRRLDVAQAIVWGVGVAMLVLAVLCALWTRRAMRRAESELERRRLVIAVISPICALVWLWLDLAGIPLVPAVLVDRVQLGLFVVSLIAAPFSLITGALLPRGLRSVRLMMSFVLLLVLVGFRLVW